MSTFPVIVQTEGRWQKNIEIVKLSVALPNSYIYTDEG